MKAFRYLCFVLAVILFTFSLPLGIFGVASYAEQLISPPPEEVPEGENEFGWKLSRAITNIAYALIYEVTSFICPICVFLFLISAWDRKLSLFLPSVIGMSSLILTMISYPILFLTEPFL